MTIPETIPEKAYFSAEEVASLFSLNRKIVYGWVKFGKLRAIKVAGSTTIRIPHESIMWLLQSRGKGNMNNGSSAMFIKMVRNMRRRISAVLRGKIKEKHSMELVGCTTDQLRAHIEKRFLPGMSFENYGQSGWHVDHIIPCARFDLTKPEHQKMCFHFTNLQPMWARDNISKGCKVTRRNIRKFIANRKDINLS